MADLPKADADDVSPVQLGTKNYMTPAGHARLRDELHRLLRQERPRMVEVVSWAAGNGDRSENGDYIYGKKRLREIDHRVRWLTKRLELAEVVDPSKQANRDRIYFGATVTYCTEADTEHTVTILGVDEADITRGEASLRSPIALALLRARVGDVVSFQTPQGVRKIEVLAIHYPG